MILSGLLSPKMSHGVEGAVEIPIVPKELRFYVLLYDLGQLCTDDANTNDIDADAGRTKYYCVGFLNNKPNESKT